MKFGKEFFFRLGLSLRFAELEFAVEYLRSSAGFGGQLQCPLPCRVCSAPLLKRGRIPSETSEVLQKIPHVEEEFRELYLYSKCLQRLDDLQTWHHFQTVVGKVFNFAVAYTLLLLCGHRL